VGLNVEIYPEPEREEREAILVALEKLLAQEALPPAYRSAWRGEAIRENLSGSADDDHHPF
jgi:hypothetical protein